MSGPELVSGLYPMWDQLVGMIQHTSLTLHAWIWPHTSPTLCAWIWPCASHLVQCMGLSMCPENWQQKLGKLGAEINAATAPLLTNFWTLGEPCEPVDTALWAKG